MTLADFNITGRRSAMPAFVATRLTPAPEHVGLPRTLFDDPIERHFYDRAHSVPRRYGPGH